VGAVDELLPVPRERVDRPGQPLGGADDDLRFSRRLPDHRIAGGRGLQEDQEPEESHVTRAESSEATRSGSSSIGTWPECSHQTSFAPGMPAAIASLSAAGTILSPRPANTTVGKAMLPSCGLASMRFAMARAAAATPFAGAWR